MEPLASIKYPVTVRLRRKTFDSLLKLGKDQGLRLGPFLSHVAETVADCPPEKFHAAMASFGEEARRR
jgi:hypothetical protein